MTKTKAKTTQPRKRKAAAPKTKTPVQDKNHVSFFERVFTGPKSVLVVRAWGEAAPKTKAAMKKFSNASRKFLERMKRTSFKKQPA